jgi:hypothetical protein
MKHIRSVLALAAVLVALPGIGLGTASAHVLKQSNGISGVLHIPPDDNPKAGEVTTLGISFGDKTGAFGLQDCDCKVAIAQDGKTLQTVVPVPALEGATLDSYSKVTFPKVGVYDVVATGTSKTGAFPTFKLDYAVRVASAAGGDLASTTASSSTNLTPIIIGLGTFALIAVVAYGAIGQGGRYAPEPVKTKSPRSKAK